MKKALLISFILFAVPVLFSKAQTFPVFEDFESYNAFSVPPGFSGDINVYLVHGTNRSQALASNMNTFNTKDSIITPLYGPVDGGAVLIYDWRFASGILYPTQTISLVPGDAFETYISDDGVNYQLIASVDQSNYVPDTTFSTNSAVLNSFAGSNIRLKFVIRRGNNPEDFWVDIDNILILDVTSIGAITNKDISFYPTIVTDRLNYTVSRKIKTGVEIYSMNGQKVKVEAMDTESGGSIDVSGLASGSYVLRLLGNQNVTYRFEKR